MNLEHIPLEPGDAQSPATRAAAELDPVAALKARQRELNGARTEEFDIPGYGGVMVAVYRRVDPDEWRKTLLLGEGSTTERCAQFLLEACEGIYYRRDGELEPAWPVDMLVRPSPAPGYGDFDAIFELGLGDAAQTVLAVFGANGNVLEEHADDVLAWMKRVQVARDLTLMGGPPVTR